MPYSTRKTYNQGYSHPLASDYEASGLLRFMRRRRGGAWGGSFLETALNVGTVGTFGVGWSLGWGLASLPLEMAHATVKGIGALERLGRTEMEFASPVVDTQMAYTMRQAALAAMHNSAYSLRAVVGNEARFLHS